MPVEFKYRLIAGLLRELQEREGYALGPDKLLQVQELLRRLPADVPPERLRSLLAPLFATEPRQQERFYELFGQCLAEARAVFAEAEEEEAAATPEQAEAQKGETRWRRILLFFPPLLALLAGMAWDTGLERWYANPVFWLAAAVLAGAAWASRKLLRGWPRRSGYLLLTLALGAAGLWLRPTLFPGPEKPVSRTVYSSAMAGDTIARSLLRAEDTARLLYTEPREVVETPPGGRFRVDSTGIGTYIAGAEAEPGAADSLTAFLTYARGTDTVYWVATITEPPAPPPPPDTGLIEEIELPYPRDIAELKIDAAARRRFDFYRQYEWPLKALLLLLLGALAWAVVRWDQYRRARVVAELRRPSRPPYVWQPETGQDAAALLAPGLQILLNRLRGRAPGRRLRPDLPATIRATSRQAGRISFVYRRPTLPPDYLLLIDRLAANDHRAHLFDSLYQVFLRAEAPVARYFYDGDPRVLFDEAHPQGIPLGELLHRYDGAQLILVGEGQGLLSPFTGRPAPWTQLLSAWPRRVLLSPRPRRAWGPRERQLEELLPLLPASPGGLDAAISLFAAEDPTDTCGLLPKVDDALHQPFTFGHGLLEDLQRQFSQPLTDWIAACALWPALHWGLTLHLGRSLGAVHGKELITFENLRELTRLPWFTEGRIPDAARTILLDYLSERGLEEPLRQSLRSLLQQAPAPPADSAAFDDYRMNLILNELFLKPGKAARRKLEREFAAYLAAGKKPDFVALRLLDREPTRLDVLLGGALKKFAFREGLPGLGWKLAPRLLAVWGALAVALLAFRPDLNPCKGGEPVAYKDMELCLDSDSARLLFLEYLAADAILAQDTQRVDSLRRAADAINLRDTAFYRNTATRYYNYAARAWNCSRQPGPGCDTLPADSLQAIACANFRRGGALSEALTGQMAIQYINAMRQACPAAAPPPAFFSLSGKVLDVRDGQPIAGATVRMGDARNVNFAELAAGTSPDVFSAATDTRGRYAFDSLPAMQVIQLRASAPGYEAGEWRGPPREELPDIRLSPTNEALEAEAWQRAVAANTPEAYNGYLVAFPEGANAA
ncbi:MAG: carboxypeptidase regulatory-like domain-containing protein, partial [Phaeodactylibacter sp.]|nr:carboxypeptidase regulatory-like domain-containing protein [Phaeodactylibacter sp.]